ncbi:outer envelope pore protein 24, chloroplastic-like [Panicum miliaceum]|uniref:Outer envelope pore protein 24, chloroplastic-like n=1 Tax=Panicum miliaceum TaxID=4540 RepID=A0A3L6RF27_PANMI|nr:outer envelope pore protein 24, chloroplastic-like [Panicum miliaceum]
MPRCPPAPRSTAPSPSIPPTRSTSPTDTNKNPWEFAVTRKFEGGDAVKGTYHASTKLLGLSEAGTPRPAAPSRFLLFYSCFHPLIIT